MRDIVRSTVDYETYLRRHIQVVEDDLKLKHIRMRESRLAFFRGTYYRWAELFPALLPKLVDSPKLTAVGDLHIENFGTFRNSSGLLEWGINDFDEVDQLPYLNDLVRLASSAIIAISEDRLAAAPKEACKAILAGYTRRVIRGTNKPFALKKRKEPFLTKLAKHSFDDFQTFWRNLRNMPYVDLATLPSAPVALLRKTISGFSSGDIVLHRRVAGIGSLGHQRFVAIYRDQKKGRNDAENEGEYSAQELKEMGPAATFWYNNANWEKGNLLDALRIRNDPAYQIGDEWLIRRVAPDCVKLELDMLPAKRKESLLLHSMGTETGNVHLKASSHYSSDYYLTVADDVKARSVDWLYDASIRMTRKLTTDWQTFREKFKV